ncbi:unnamed protein product [Bursaphelenchus okinawaensis]|uniref:Uncharacterized protein n=1 Tax=Bursaphelenchus okinawaensis TaxID=465554 RepID=A0A811KTE6_9BILA|nr:unnamed protein product [Bursaphelenchus okinawaensis]CAG9112034.1 unnamed protein product [Bursaphelenchus okinawaensis]
MSFLAFRVAVFLLALSFATASTVNFVNQCGNGIDVIRTENGAAPVVQCHLERGQRCSGSFGSNGMNFKQGWQGRTLAEFTFNGGYNNDYWDLSVVDGFDVGMVLEGNGITLVCRDRGCPDAYQHPGDNSKTHGGPSGVTYTLTFCG